MKIKITCLFFCNLIGALFLCGCQNKIYSGLPEKSDTVIAVDVDKIMKNNSMSKYLLRDLKSLESINKYGAGLNNLDKIIISANTENYKGDFGKDIDYCIFILFKNDIDIISLSKDKEFIGSYKISKLSGDGDPNLKLLIEGNARVFMTQMSSKLVCIASENFNTEIKKIPKNDLPFGENGSMSGFDDLVVYHYRMPKITCLKIEKTINENNKKSNETKKLFKNLALIEEVEMHADFNGGDLIVDGVITCKDWKSADVVSLFATLGGSFLADPKIGILASDYKSEQYGRKIELSLFLSGKMLEKISSKKSDDLILDHDGKKKVDTENK